MAAKISLSLCCPLMIVQIIAARYASFIHTSRNQRWKKSGGRKNPGGRKKYFYGLKNQHILDMTFCKGHGKSKPCKQLAQFTST